MASTVQSDVDAIPEGRQIGLNVINASPPVDAYVGKDDQLWVMTACSLSNTVLTVTARLLLPDGTIVPNQWTIAAPNQRTGFFTPLALPECFILSVAVVSNSSFGAGTVYVTLNISRGVPSLAQQYQVLVKGYVNGSIPLCYPGGLQTTNLDCAGNIRTVTGTTPAAGTNSSDTVPTGAKWQVLAIQLQLVSSVTVANRVVAILFDDGGSVFSSNINNVVQAASSTFTWSFAPGLINQAVVNNIVMTCIPNKVFLYPGYRIRSSILALQAGDQISQIFYQVQEWLLP